MIPDYQSVMLPLLRLAQDGQEHRINSAIEALGRELQLTQSELEEMLPSGRQPVFNNRVHWAKTYLAQAKLLEVTRRAYFRITERGREILAKSPPKVDVKLLEQFPEFNDFKQRARNSQESGSLAATSETGAVTETASPVELSTPDEVLRNTITDIEAALSAELLDRIIAAPPSFFEELIVTLLLRMGYGGSRAEAGRAVGRSGDGGIDGVIDQDPLGLDRVYLQAKRYKPETLVSEPEIRAFSGSLGAAKASKGVFVTTSSFTRPAYDFAEKHPFKMVLIDGKQLTKLMIRHDVGVRTAETLHVKKLDEDFFNEE